MQICTTAMITRPDQMCITVLYALVSKAEQTIAHQQTYAEAAGLIEECSARVQILIKLLYSPQKLRPIFPTFSFIN